jgi:glycine/D-amino acid oxidase-like deaminating enzyme
MSDDEATELFDLAVVGSGFLGLSAATAFASARPGSAVLIISPQTTPIEGSASASTGGHILPGFELSCFELLARYGQADAKRLFDFTLEGIRHLIGDATHAARCPTIIGTTAPNEIASMQEEIEALQQLGHSVTRLKARDLAARGLKGCLAGYRDHSTAILRGEQRLADLHQRARSLGVASKNARVTAIDQTPHDMTLATISECGSETIRARKLVVAAGENTAGLIGSSDPVRTQTTTSFRFDAPQNIQNTPNMVPSPDHFAACQHCAEPEYTWVQNNEIRFGIRATPSPTIESAIERITHRFGEPPGPLREVRSGLIVHRQDEMPSVAISDTHFAAYGFGGHGVVLSNWLGHLAGCALSGDLNARTKLSDLHARLSGGTA